MKYDPQKHHRVSTRLKGYDYSQPGIYFVTVCTQHRLYLFGEVVNRKMILNDAGKMIRRIWNDLPKRFDFIRLDEYVVMPNHFHGIIEIRKGDYVRGDHKDRPIVDPNRCTGDPLDRPFLDLNRCTGDPRDRPSLDRCTGDPRDRPLLDPNRCTGDPRDRPFLDRCTGDPRDRPSPRGTLPGTLGRIMQAFLSLTTCAYIDGVRHHGWRPFPIRLWQRNYHDYVARNEQDYHRIQVYIRANPARWKKPHT